MVRSLVAALLSVLAAGRSGAVPQTIDQQGRILKSDGTPETGSLKATFALYSGDVQVWVETQLLSLDKAGFYSASLGSVTPFPDALFREGPLFLGIAIGDEAEMTPRLPMLSVPYALVAEDVVGDIHPTSITVNGIPIVDSKGSVPGCRAPDRPDLDRRTRTTTAASSTRSTAGRTTIRIRATGTRSPAVRRSRGRTFSARLRGPRGYARR